ncbi:VOC family protein [Halocola ammonii]
MKNALHWFEIPATDIKRAKAFYEEIFDFKMQDFDLGDQIKMALFPTDQTGVGGALCQNHEFYKPGDQGPLVYLNADPDLQKVLDKLEKKNGTIIQPKTLVSEDIGYMAVIKDSEGNRVALMSGK